MAPIRTRSSALAETAQLANQLMVDAPQAPTAQPTAANPPQVPTA